MGSVRVSGRRTRRGEPAGIVFAPAPLSFDIDDAVEPSRVTGRAGVPLAIELFRQLGVAATIDAQLSVKERQRGLRASQLVESLVAVWVAGGDRC